MHLELNKHMTQNQTETPIVLIESIGVDPIWNSQEAVYTFVYCANLGILER